MGIFIYSLVYNILEVKKMHKIIVTKIMNKNHWGGNTEGNLVTLMDGEKIIFDKLKPFQAHRQLHLMGLKHLITFL